jgi:hypothetical protein
MILLIFGIRSSESCGSSNIDFVHFIWDNLDYFSLKKYAVTIVRYRAENDGWHVKVRCSTYQISFQDILRPFSSCGATNTFPCNIRFRNPSLLASAGHFLYHVFNLTQFELTPYTTHDAYVYAVNLNRVDSFNLLPPKFPFITVVLRYIHPNRRVHFGCRPGKERSWNADHEFMFGTVAMAVHDLLSYWDVYWCEHCDKPCSAALVAKSPTDHPSSLSYVTYNSLFYSFRYSKFRLGY